MKKQKPVCNKCGAPATRANLGPRLSGGESYLCETDFETYRNSHSQIEVFAWLRLRE